MKADKDRVQSLFDSVDARRDQLVETTVDLLKIPTFNPPGDNYLEICEHIEARLQPSGFESIKLRAEGALGDSDKYPRWNVIARHEGVRPGPCVHFNAHTDIVALGEGWTRDPFGGDVEAGPYLWARVLRHERAGWPQPSSLSKRSSRPYQTMRAR
jgi:succinyl-diaminopimelate desuccinylase